VRRPPRRASTAVFGRAAEGFSRTTGVVSSLFAVVGSDWCGHLRGLGTCPAVATGAEEPKGHSCRAGSRNRACCERPMTSARDAPFPSLGNQHAKREGAFLGWPSKGSLVAGEGWSGLRQRRGQARWRLGCGRHERRSRVDPLRAERGRGDRRNHLRSGGSGLTVKPTLPPSGWLRPPRVCSRPVSGPLHRPQTDVPPVDGGA
jgi:hypothetical protein